MIPNNGTIEIKSSNLGGYDEEGNPIPATTVWDNPIPCRIITNNRSVEGRYKDGEFVISSYVVYIDGVGELKADRVRLTRQGVLLGEFNVQNNEYLRLVGRNKINV